MSIADTNPAHTHEVEIEMRWMDKFLDLFKMKDTIAAKPVTGSVSTGRNRRHEGKIG